MCQLWTSRSHQDQQEVWTFLFHRPLARLLIGGVPQDPKWEIKWEGRRSEPEKTGNRRPSFRKAWSLPTETIVRRLKKTKNKLELSYDVKRAMTEQRRGSCETRLDWPNEEPRISSELQPSDKRTRCNEDFGGKEKKWLKDRRGNGLSTLTQGPSPILVGTVVVDQYARHHSVSLLFFTHTSSPSSFLHHSQSTSRTFTNHVSQGYVLCLTGR